MSFFVASAPDEFLAEKSEQRRRDGTVVLQSHLWGQRTLQPTFLSRVNINSPPPRLVGKKLFNIACRLVCLSLTRTVVVVVC